MFDIIIIIIIIIITIIIIATTKSGQAAGAQSARYYCNTQTKTHRSGHLPTLLCQRTKISVLLSQYKRGHLR